MRGFRRLALLGLFLWLLAVLARAGIAASFDLRMMLPDARRAVEMVASAPEDGCRVLVVGSSPTLFGLSATELEAATGCRSANLSMIDMGGRLDDYLDRVLPHLRLGDVLVLADRRWTQAGSGDDACAGQPAWACLAGAIHFAPYVVERLRLVLPLSLPRDSRGDLLNHPPMTARRFVYRELPLDDLMMRASLAVGQAGAIRARGACAVLAPVPMLVAPEAIPTLQAAYDRLGRQVTEQAADAAWLPPLLETAPDLFVLEGQHPSAAERLRWTARVAGAVRDHCRPADSSGRSG